MPEERHDHYDAAGTFTGHTIVTRGTFWTPEAQDAALARAVVKGRLCTCGCGNKAADTQRDDNRETPGWDVHTKVCTARAATEAVRRAMFDDDPEAEPVVKPTDGLLAWATPRKEQA